MGVFDDKKFEQLDWMTQMTETIDSSLNELLARLPERTEIDSKTLLNQLGSSYLTLSISSVVRELTKNHIKSNLSYDEQQTIDNCFKFETDGEIELNAETQSVSGKIYLVKVVPTLADEDLQGMMGAKGIEAVGNLTRNCALNFDRLNEILDILGNCAEAMRCKSGKKKVRAIQDRLRKVFSTNEWRIRDMDLSNKVGYWIWNYVQDGNLADLTNLCKLKVMTHNNMPIYSVEEEK